MLIKNQHSSHQQCSTNSISQASHSTNQELKITHHNESSNCYSENLPNAKKSAIAKKWSGGSHQTQEFYSTASGVSVTNNNSIVSKGMDSAASTELSSKLGNHKIKKRNSKLNFQFQLVLIIYFKLVLSNKNSDRSPTAVEIRRETEKASPHDSRVTVDGI